MKYVISSHNLSIITAADKVVNATMLKISQVVFVQRFISTAASSGPVGILVEGKWYNFMRVANKANNTL